MAQDIKIVFDPDKLAGDFGLQNGELSRDDGIETAVLISLFTDRRADESDNYDNKDRKGWWGDLLSEIEEDQIGSKLYLLNRAKATTETVNKTKEYAYEALEWMLEDGVAENIEVDAWTFGDRWNLRLGLEVKIYQSDENIFTLKFDDLWKNTEAIGG